MNRPDSGACDAGFSLLEVLVTIAVAALVISALSGFTRMMTNAELYGERQQASHESIVGAARVFRHVAARAVPDLRHDSEMAAVVGTPKRLTFLSRGPSIMALDRPVPITLLIENGDGGSKLLLSWREPASEAIREELLIPSARSIVLSYFGFGRERDGERWHSRWDQPQRLPRAILLQVQMSELASPVDIVARTYSTLPYACIALPHEPLCHTGTTP
jgi:general secretion pathway protein J